MKLDIALAGISRLGVDTGPVIYFVEAHPQYDRLVVEVFSRVVAGRFRAVTSIVTLSEVLVRPLAIADAPLAQRYRTVLSDSQRFDLLPIDRPAAEQAAELRARYRLYLPDALQIAVALGAGCQAFLTNDRRLQRVTELTILVLDDLQL